MTGKRPWSEVIVLVAPHGRAVTEERGWSTRPARLAEAMVAAGAEVVIISRTSPWKTWKARGRVRWNPRMGVAFESVHAMSAGLTLIEHPFPAGPLEQRAITRIIRSLPCTVKAVIVTDPRSAGVLRHDLPGIGIFDAYDAWDLSPLFRGRHRVIREIRAGYRIAAAHSDLVIANTPLMGRRMRSLGASETRLLPNGGPEPAPLAQIGRDVLYVGNVQDRVRVDLLRAASEAADAAGAALRVVGAIQNEPPGWRDLIGRPNVHYVGPAYGAALERELAVGGVGVVPHRVDDYTLSQDAMKVWDYLAHGIAVVSTPVPPASQLHGSARIANNPASFRDEVASAMASRDRTEAEGRRAVARENTWGVRARTLLSLIEGNRG